MSIKVLTWAFGLTVEPRAKIALLAIADNADDDGVAWPSRDLVAQKSSQSRTTVNRRIAYLVDLGVMTLHARFRPDGSQTTDEIRINMAITSEEVMRRAQAWKVAQKGKSAAEDDDDSAHDADAGRGRPVDTPPVQPEAPGAPHVAPRGLHCGHPHNEPSVEPDRIGDARARPGAIFTAGSKALADVFWKALGIDSPLQIPPELAGIDYRAVMWEQAGWPPDLVDTETRRFASDRPFKPISYFEKVFATAFAKRQAPLPVVAIRDAEKLTVTADVQAIGNHRPAAPRGSAYARISARLAAGRHLDRNATEDG